MDKDNIEQIAKMCIDMGLGEEFYFTVCENDNNEIQYNVGVKLIEEFSSLLVLFGNCGGGLNRVVLANDNIINREEYMMAAITEELTDELKNFKFVEIERN